MGQIIAWLKQGLLVLGLTSLVMLGMLLGAILVRPLMIVALAALLVAFVLSVVSPRVRAWLESPAHH